MSFLKETDYHGSRTYDGEGAAQILMNSFRLRVSLVFAWARLQIEKFLRVAAAPPPAERGFTLLGTEERALPRRPAMSDIFPISNSGDRTRATQSDS